MATQGRDFCQVRGGLSANHDARLALALCNHTRKKTKKKPLHWFPLHSPAVSGFGEGMSFSSRSGGTAFSPHNIAWAIKKGKLGRSPLSMFLSSREPVPSSLGPQENTP